MIFHIFVSFILFFYFSTKILTPEFKFRPLYLAKSDRCLIVLFCLLFFGSSAYLFKNDGFFLLYPDNFTEAFGNYLLSFNVKSFSTFMLQDVSNSPLLTGHPYFYIHHPNLVSRIFSWFFIFIGNLGIEHQMIYMIGFSLTSLTMLFSFMKSYAGSKISWGVIIYLVTTMSLFLKSIGDPVRGLLFILLCLFLFWQKDEYSRKKILIKEQILIFLLTLSDWGFFVVFIGIALLIKVGSQTKIKTKLLIFIQLSIPVILALSIYFSTIIYAVGFDFFIFDLKATFLGRGGHVSSNVFNGIDAIKETVLHYKNNFIVTWIRNPLPLFISELSTFYSNSFRFQNLLLVPLSIITWANICRNHSSDNHQFKLIQFFSGISVLFLIAVFAHYSFGAVNRLNLGQGVPFLILFAFVTFCFYQSFLKNKKILFIYLIFLFIIFLYIKFAVPLIVFVPILFIFPFLINIEDISKPLVPLLLCVYGYSLATCVFPEYFVRFLLRHSYSPGILIDSILASTFFFIALEEILRPLKWGKVKKCLLNVVPFVFLSILLYQFTHELLHLSPSKSPLKNELSLERYKGKTFYTNIDPSVVWYFTRGFAFNSDTIPVSKLHRPQDSKYFFTRDWKSDLNYHSPDFYLCYKSANIPVESISASERTESCQYIASKFSEDGHIAKHIGDQIYIIETKY